MTYLSGMLLLDKPPGPTSHDVVGRVRTATGVRRVGHAGTLDPFASGLLILLVGPATRLSEYFLGMDKSYEATARLGVETDTHDRDGVVVGENPGWQDLDRERIQEALSGFLGVNPQLPPRFSAKKVRGEPAHRRVRRGETVELESVDVEITRLELMNLRLPDLALRVRCSSGTYVRALARDLGRALGVGAHLTALRRTAIGPFGVAAALPLGELEGLGSLGELLIPPARAMGHLPAVEIGAEEAALVRQGRFLSLEGRSFPEGEPLCILREGTLLAVGCRVGNEIRPRKVLGHD